MIIFTWNILVGQAVQTQIRHCEVWLLIRVSTDRFQTALSNFVCLFFLKSWISPNCTQIENRLIQSIKMEKSILHKLINMIQLFYGAKMMHQYLTSIVFCLYFLFHLFKRNIQNILFFFFFLFKMFKKFFFFLMSNIIVNITCLVQLDRSFYSVFISNYLNSSRGLFITHAVNS